MASVLYFSTEEYVQLHRDTTFQSLTLAPSFKSGVVVWEDSPLLRAVKYGRCLVVDEADKAPVDTWTGYDWLKMSFIFPRAFAGNIWEYVRTISNKVSLYVF